MGLARDDSPTLTARINAAEPNSQAISGVSGESLEYQDLASAVARIAGQLKALGIRRNDRVALVLPNGPEAAVLTLAVAV